MRTIPTRIWDLWNNGGPFVGEEGEAVVRLTVEPNWYLSTATPTTDDPTKLPFRWWQSAANDQLEVEIPNYRSMTAQLSLDQDAAEATIVLNNAWMDPNSSGQAAILGDPGYFTPERGADGVSERWPDVEPNAWEGVIIEGAVLRTYIGYGGADKTIGEALTDGNIVPWGVWQIDDLVPSVDGQMPLISCKCRSIAALLIDQILTRPLVPAAWHPVSFCRFEFTPYYTGPIPVYDSTDPVEQSPDGFWKWMVGIAAGAGGGYWVVGTDGGVFSYHTQFWGSMGDGGLSAPIADMAAHPDRLGYWLVSEDGEVYAFGSADYLGGLGSPPANPIRRIRATPSGNGYWMMDSDGEVYPFGDAVDYGGTPATVQPLVDMAVTSTGAGYWLLAANGDVFPFGDATDHGDATATGKVFAGMAAKPDDSGYWLAAVDANVYGYGTAVNYGPVPTDPLQDPIFGIARTDTGLGYWLVGGDGGVFAYGDARFWGSLPGGFTVIERSDANYQDYCVDDETEILTKRGWLRCDEVGPGDVAFALDPETGESVWSEVLHVHRRHREDISMLSSETARHSSLTTLNHRWFVNHKRFGWEWRTSDSLDIQSQIPMAAPPGHCPAVAKYSDDFVELVAWFWTEGCASGGRYSFSQSERAHPDNVNRIDALMGRLFGPPGPLRALNEDGDNYSWVRRTTSKRIVHFCLSKVAAQELAAVVQTEAKFVSLEFLASLTRAQLELFINISLEADGSVRNNSTTLTQEVEERTTRFGIACALAGRPYRQWECDDGSGITLFQNGLTTVIPSAAAKFTGENRTKYTGVVWCPTTEHGTWFARRRGQHYFTGNSDIVRLLLLWSGWLLNGSGDDVYGNLETTGAYGDDCLKADLFDKKPVIDGIKIIREITGHIFMIDEEGAARFEVPNFWTPGNHDETGTYTSFIPDIDENLQITSYQVTRSTAPIRSEINVGSDRTLESNDSTRSVKRTPEFQEVLRGRVRPMFVGVPDSTTLAEMELMAEMIEAHIRVASQAGTVTIPFNPAIQLNDQVRVWERTLAETRIHYVRSIGMSHDQATGVLSETLTMNALGTPEDWWWSP